MSSSRVRQLHSKGLPRRIDGKYDAEKVIAWNEWRLANHRPPTHEEMEPKSLEERAIVVADKRELAEKYRLNRAEVFVGAQRDRMELAERILATMTDAEVQKMKPSEKSTMLKALDVGTAVLYDKERLEKGESTENVAVMIDAIKRIKRKRTEQYGRV